MAEMISFFFLAIALGMDAFSVSLGIGMQTLRLKRIFLIGLVIGLFHFIMPFLGILFGMAIAGPIGDFAEAAGGLLLTGIGLHMFFQAFQEDDSKQIRLAPVGISLLVIGFSVSMDSFSVGLSLGIAGARLLIALFFFCTVSMVMAWMGMLLARKAKRFLGIYSELLGGSILIGFGLYSLFG